MLVEISEIMKNDAPKKIPSLNSVRYRVQESLSFSIPGYGTVPVEEFLLPSSASGKKELL